jgi:phasin family protein
MATKKTPSKKSAPASAEKQAVRKAANSSEQSAEKTVTNLYDLKRTAGMENIMTQGKAKFEKFGQEAAAHGKDHVEAITRSGGIFAKGFEEFLKTYSTLAQSAAERNAQAFKSLLGSKTLNEFTETQTRVAQENLDDFLSGVTKLSELSVRLATETLEPINEQVTKSIKKASESLAA